MFDAEALEPIYERLHGDFRRTITQTCLKHWQHHPFDQDFDAPMDAVWEALALDIFEDEAQYRITDDKE